MQQKDCSVYIFSYFLCLVSPTSSLYLLVRLYIVSGLELLFGVMSMSYCALKVETRVANGINADDLFCHRRHLVLNMLWLN